MQRWDQARANNHYRTYRPVKPIGAPELRYSVDAKCACGCGYIVCGNLQKQATLLDRKIARYKRDGDGVALVMATQQHDKGCAFCMLVPQAVIEALGHTKVVEDFVAHPEGWRYTCAPHRRPASHARPTSAERLKERMQEIREYQAQLAEHQAQHVRVMQQMQTPEGAREVLDNAMARRHVGQRYG